MRPDGSWKLTLVLVAALLLAAGSAGAQAVFSMSGKIATGAGLFVRIPAAGITPCPSFTALRTASPTMAPQNSPFPAPVGTMVPLQPNGCVPGGPAPVTTTGAGGFQLPPGFFSQPNIMGVVPIPNSPMVVQLATSWAVTAPPPSPVEALAARRNVGAMGTTFGYAPWASFRHMAYLNQTGRIGPNFTACAAPVGGLMFAPYPASGAKVSCTAPSQGSIPGYVKNIAGPAGGFGGTMGLVLNGTAGVGGNLAVTIGPGSTLLIALLQTMGSRPAGRGYAAYSTDYLPPGPVYLMYQLTMPGPSGLIGMVSTYLGPGPSATNRNWAFPFTTGNLVIRGTGQTPYGVNPVGGSFSLSGYDARTPMGAGNIQLVAGAVATSTVQGPNGTPNYTVMRLPEPRRPLTLLAGALALIAIAAWRRTARS